MRTVVLGMLSIALMGARPFASDADELATERRVHGVITSIDPSALTIASSQRAVTAKIDPARTKVTIGGHPGKLADLKLAAHAKGEACLDDVWVAIDAH